MAATPEYFREYNKRSDVIARHQTPEFKAKRKAYRDIPEVKHRADELRKLPCRKARAKVFQKRRQLQRLYGLTESTVADLKCKQRNACRICETEFAEIDHKANSPHIDHKHGTKEVRGILCTNCNLMLGHAKDKPEILVRGAAYLTAHNVGLQ